MGKTRVPTITKTYEVNIFMMISETIKDLLQLVVRAFAPNFWYIKDSGVMVVRHPHYQL